MWKYDGEYVPGFGWVIWRWFDSNAAVRGWVVT